MASLWESLTKPQIKLMPLGHTTRCWFVDLNACPGFEPRDLFDPHCWRNVRVRRAHDRSPFMAQLGEGDIVRVVHDDDDFDLVVRAVLPGAVVMALRGSRTPWDELTAAEASATEARRAAVQAKAQAMMGETA